MRRSSSNDDLTAGVATRLTALALVLLVSACGPQSPADPAESQTPTAGPWTGELRYEPIDAAICEAVDLDGVLEQAGLTMERPRFLGPTSDPAAGAGEPSYWAVSCGFDTAPDDVPYLYSADLGVVVTDDPKLAHDAYEIEVDSVEQQMSGEADEAERWGDISPVDGWWTEGIYARYAPEQRVISIDYRVYHENLHMRTSFNMAYDPARFEPEAVAETGRELAETLTDAAIQVVPCEVADGVAPPTHCDSQG